MKKIVFKGKRITIEQETMMIKGKETIVERKLGPKVAIIIPLLADGVLLMERNYRPAIKKHLFELPAGKIDSGETPIAAARRELKEETGYEAKRMRFLFRAYASPGMSTEEAYFFEARQLKATHERHLGDMELIELKPTSLNKLLNMVKKNEIRDSKTIAGILYYAKFLS